MTSSSFASIKQPNSSRAVSEAAIEESAPLVISTWQVPVMGAHILERFFQGFFRARTLRREPESGVWTRRERDKGDNPERNAKAERRDASGGEHCAEATEGTMAQH